MTDSQKEDDTLSSRVEKLDSAFAKTLAKVVQTFTFEQFVDCFPLLCASQRDAVDILHPIYTTLVTRFIENTQVRTELVGLRALRVRVWPTENRATVKNSLLTALTAVSIACLGLLLTHVFCRRYAHV